MCNNNNVFTVCVLTSALSAHLENRVMGMRYSIHRTMELGDGNVCSFVHLSCEPYVNTEHFEERRAEGITFEMVVREFLFARTTYARRHAFIII